MTLGPQFVKITQNEVDPYQTSYDKGPIKSDYFRGASREDTYQYRPSPFEVGAELTVRHDEGGSLIETPVRGKELEWAEETAEDNGQIPLLRVRPLAPESTVSHMVGTRGARHAAMTALGIAQVETDKEFGRSLTPSNNLSAHSQRLVEHLDEVGAASKPEHVYSNTWDFLPNNRIVPMNPRNLPKPIPEETVRAGRTRIRSVIKAGRKKKESVDGSMQLPGMED